MGSRSKYDKVYNDYTAVSPPFSIASTVTQIMRRIDIARPESPIAVFKVNNKLVAVFGATVKTRAMIDDVNCVGFFDKTMDLNKVVRLLHAEIK